MTTEERIIALEHDALSYWSGGNAVGYLLHAADDVTYFDDIGANRGLIGLDAVTAHFKVIAEMLPVHKYELEGTNVQVMDNTAVLICNYIPTSLEGEALTPWRATIVYTKRGDDWKVVHMHWTMHKEI